MRLKECIELIENWKTHIKIVQNNQSSAARNIYVGTTNRIYGC